MFFRLSCFAFAVFLKVVSVPFLIASVCLSAVGRIISKSGADRGRRAVAGFIYRAFTARNDSGVIAVRESKSGKLNLFLVRQD